MNNLFLKINLVWDGMQQWKNLFVAVFSKFSAFEPNKKCKFYFHVGFQIFEATFDMKTNFT